MLKCMSSLYESFPELSGNEVFVKGARMNDTQNTARRKSCSYLCPEEGVMLHVGIDTDNNKTAFQFIEHLELALVNIKKV